MISVFGSDKLKAVVLAMRAADRDLRNDINRETRRILNPVWRDLVQLHSTYRRDARVIAQGARIQAGNPPVAVAATSRRQLSGGLVPVDDWRNVEFGADRNKVATYSRRNRKSGGTHQVTRHTQRQFPPRTRQGRVAYQAFADIAPRAVALWVQLIMRKYHDAAEKGDD